MVQVELEAVARRNGQPALKVDGELLLDLGDQIPEVCQFQRFKQQNNILVAQLGKASTLVRVKEHIVDVEKGAQVVGRQGRKSRAAGLQLEGDHQASAIVVDVIAVTSHKPTPFSIHERGADITYKSSMRRKLNCTRTSWY